MRQLKILLKDCTGKMKLTYKLENSLLKMQMSLEAATDFLSLLSPLEHFPLSTILVNPLVYSQFLPSTCL